MAGVDLMYDIHSRTYDITCTPSTSRNYNFPIVRGPRSQGFFGVPGKYPWNGCPDLVFWNGSQLRFVEVKSSTDTLKKDQIILRDELTSAGFHYAVAVTQDSSGGRRMRGGRAAEGGSKRGRRYTPYG